MWQAQYFLHSDAFSRGRHSTLRAPMLFRVAGAILSALRCCFAWQAQCFILPCEGWPPWAVFLRGRLLSALRCCFAWHAQCSLHSDAVLCGRRITLCYFAKVGRRWPPRGGGLLAWQARHFLHSDADSRGRRALCTPMLFRVAGTVLSALRCCFAWQPQCSLHSDAVLRGRRSTLYYFAKVGRHGPPRGGGLLAWQARHFLHCDAVSRGRHSTLCTPMLFRVAGAVLSALRCCFAWQAQYFILLKVGRRGPPWGGGVLRGRRDTFCTPMLFRVAGTALSALSRSSQYFILPAVGRHGRRSSCGANAILSALRD